MLALLRTTDSLTAVLSDAALSANPVYSAQVENDGQPTEPVGSLAGATTVTIVPAPDRGETRVSLVRFYNADTVPATITLAKVAGGTSYVIGKTTVPAGGFLIADASGLRLVDANGQTLQSSSDTAGQSAGLPTNSVAASETTGLVHKTVLTLTDLPVTVGNTTGVSFGGSKIYDFPAGRILILGVTAADISFDLTDAGNVTPIDDTMGGDIAIGSTAPDDGTLDGTDVDLLPSTSIDPISGGVTGAALAASAQLDGTTDAVDAYFNILIDDADVGDGASDVLLVSGTVTIHWVNLGDY